MSTIGQEISTIRNLIKEVTDDSNYTDSFLYELWVNARSSVMRQARNINNFNWLTFCIEMELRDYRGDCSDCGGGFTCKKMMSKYEIPSGVQGIGSEAINVMTPDHINIPMRFPEELRSSGLDPIKKRKPVYTFENRRIVLHNAQYKIVYIRTIPEDPAAWINVRNCEDMDCPDLMSMDASMDKSYAIQVIRQVIMLLDLPIKLQEDAHVQREPDQRT